MKDVKRIRPILSGIIAIALCVSSVAPAFAVTDQTAKDYDLKYYGNEALTCNANTSSAPGGAGSSSAPLPSTVPDPWRSLIDKTAALYPTADRRLVATTLWVENRGWPAYTAHWANSGAGAQGPWQFIPSTWAAMGTDGDGDGIADPNNPADAVHAAFKHQLGSAGKPILTNATGDAQKDYDATPFYRDRQNLMSFLASYNGSGAPNGVAISAMPNNENSNYLRMSYWLIASNFEKSINTTTGAFIDATKAGTLFVNSATQGATAAPTAAAIQVCPGASTGYGAVDPQGFAFPILLGKNEVTNNQGAWPCPGVCHHDGTPAADLFKAPFPPGLHATEGVKVVAIEDGKIAGLDNAYKGITGCQAIVFEGKSGHGYWYGHLSNATVSVGQEVKAGSIIASVGSYHCTGNDSPAHLHIDMSDTYNGIGINRSQAFVPLINKLYEELPS